MDKGRFRVVLTGELVAGHAREGAISALSRLFETSAGQLVNVFDGRETLIGAVLDAAEASALQRRIEQVGARARIEPAGTPPVPNAMTLQLPERDEPSAAGLMRCPACGHQQLVARRCDECGVVFADYNRARHAAGAPGGAGQRATPATSGVSSGLATPQGGVRQPPRNDIHTTRGGAWQDAWVQETDELPTEQDRLRLFMGPGSTRLAIPCERMIRGRRTRLTPGWAGGAVLSPFLWAFFRKMYAWGLLIFVADVFLPVLLITLGSREGISDKLTYLGIALLVGNRVFWPLVGKFLYCRHARSTIAYMNRMSPTYASDIDIATAGGTSRTSVFVGIVIALVTVMLTWSTADKLHGDFYRRAATFAQPSEVPSWPQQDDEGGEPGVANDAAAGPTDELLANENRWVATRNRLRRAGQRIANWLRNADAGIDPANQSMNQIGAALMLPPADMLDAWGKQFRFESTGQGFRLVSAGADGTFDTPDDVEYRRALKR